MLKVTFKSRTPEYKRKKSRGRSTVRTGYYETYQWEETVQDETAARIRALALGWEIVKIEKEPA